MAQASKREVVQTPVYEYVLTLSRDEAEMLHAVTGLISGNEVTTSRKHTKAIRAALQRVGICSDSSDVDITGGIRATDYI